MFEVAPSLFMVELHKAHGDTLEYHSVSSHSICFPLQMNCVTYLGQFFVLLNQTQHNSEIGDTTHLA